MKKTIIFLIIFSIIFICGLTNVMALSNIKVIRGGFGVNVLVYFDDYTQWSIEVRGSNIIRGGMMNRSFPGMITGNLWIHTNYLFDEHPHFLWGYGPINITVKLLYFGTLLDIEQRVGYIYGPFVWNVK